MSGDTKKLRNRMQAWWRHGWLPVAVGFVAGLGGAVVFWWVVYAALVILRG